jgi:membrane dipeptidase
MDAEAAKSLHSSSLVIDTHSDSLVAHIRRGNQSMFDPDVHLGPESAVGYLRGPLDSAAQQDEVQLNFPKMRVGGIDCAFCAVDVTRARKNHATYALDAFGFLMHNLEAHPDEVVVARTAQDIRDAKVAGKLSVVMAVENSDGVEGSLYILRMLYEMGVRSLGLTHNTSSWAADGNAEARSGGGLTTFGVALVKELNRLGVVVDVSHISERGFWDVLEIADRPILASHSNCKAVCDHPRNLTDDQIRAVAKTGGSIGVIYYKSFVDTEAPTLDRLLDHVDHIVQLVGPDHVGLGSDFDGGGTLVKDAAAVPELTEMLAARGYGKGDLRKILGENHLRVFEEAVG